MRRILSLYAIGLLFLSLSSQVVAQGAYKVVSVNNGVNRLMLDGREAMVIRAWRENFNAHGFDVVSIFVHGGAENDAESWLIVPIFREQDGNFHEDFHVLAGGGADCQPHDFRLLTTAAGNRAQLIVAERDMGNNYAAPAHVRFDYYVLAKNSDGAPGHPTLYFNWQKSVFAHSQYCDVNRAFDEELHLGNSSGTLSSDNH